MTIENELYGAGWHTCSSCGVKDREDQLARVAVVGGKPSDDSWKHVDSKAAVCAEWKKTLDGISSLKLSNVKAGALEQIDALLAEANGK